VDYGQALPVQLTREFLGAPEKFLRYLLADDGEWRSWGLTLAQHNEWSFGLMMRGNRPGISAVAWTAPCTRPDWSCRDIGFRP
jgi:hypothetical protein